MRKGELTSQSLPRIYVVFEGLLGKLPDAKSKGAELLARKRKKWDQVADCYQLNIPTRRGLQDLYWRQNFRVDVITFIDPGFVRPLREKLDHHNLLFGDVHYYDVETLLSDLTYERDVLTVLDPDPSRILTWGSKGRYVTPDVLNIMNVIW